MWSVWEQIQVFHWSKSWPVNYLWLLLDYSIKIIYPLLIACPKARVVNFDQLYESNGKKNNPAYLLFTQYMFQMALTGTVFTEPCGKT